MFFAILIQPIINLLVFFYSLVPGHDFGIAIILVTIVIRLLIWPLQTQTLRSQKQLQKIQPEIKKIQDKYKNDPQKMQAKVMELYKEKEVNPFSSCLPSLLQLPIMIGLFYAVFKFENAEYLNLINQGQGLAKDLYPFIYNLPFVKSALSVPFSTMFLGLVDLAKPSIILAILAGLTQFIQTKMILPKEQDPAQKANTMVMLYGLPVFIAFIATRYAAALPLYWIVTSLMAILQQYLVMQHDIEVLEEDKK